METRDFLEDARRAGRELRAAMDRRRDCEAVRRAVGDGAGGNLIALEGELTRRAEAWAALQRRALAAIDRVDDPFAREVLRYRYLDGLGWSEVAARVGRSQRWVMKVHARAVRKWR